MDNSTLTSSDTAEHLDSSAFVHLGDVLYGSYTTKDFERAAAFVADVAQAADTQNHHPDVRLGYGKVSFELSSHDAGGVTERDLALAHEIQRIADEAGVVAEAVHTLRYDFAIDTVDADRIRDFWRIGMGYVERAVGDEIELVDPRGRGPKLWFQHMDPPRTDRNRIHFDVYVPADDAESRVQAVLEAGGTLMTDEYAPDWWVLADVEGNELCVCTAD
jgi:4a-hydroxytetrahydrobiopterin dehydratase